MAQTPTSLAARIRRGTQWVLVSAVIATAALGVRSFAQENPTAEDVEMIRAAAALMGIQAPKRMPAKEAATPVAVAESKSAPVGEMLAQVRSPMIAPSAPAPLPDIKSAFFEVPPDPMAFEDGVVQVGCSSCSGGGLLGLMRSSHDPMAVSGGSAGCSSCGSGGGDACNNGCVPGRANCEPCCADSHLGRFLCGLTECFCCPDPCYDPHWMPIADAAFFVDAVRPQTQTRIRWDAGRSVILPDRNEYFWARSDGKGKGPGPKAPLFTETRMRYDSLSMYTEGATGSIGAFVNMPYMTVEGEQFARGSGFADMTIGTKTLLFDCELLQVSFQFSTYLPIGNFFKGIGVGHVSLEPALLFGLRLGPETFLQSQIAEWVPIGGDPNYSGSILRTATSVNQSLCTPFPNTLLVGTFEVQTWTFQDGAFTDPYLGSDQRSSGTSYVSMGPGLRLFVCDKVDLGFGTNFSVTGEHLARQQFRTEFRFRF